MIKSKNGKEYCSEDVITDEKEIKKLLDKADNKRD